jgi:hypothetical protein
MVRPFWFIRYKVILMLLSDKLITRSQRNNNEKRNEAGCGLKNGLILVCIRESFVKDILIKYLTYSRFSYNHQSL